MKHGSMIDAKRRKTLVVPVRILKRYSIILEEEGKVLDDRVSPMATPLIELT